MSLRNKQSEFSIMVANLIIYAASIGYETTLGDAYRDPRTHGKQGQNKGYGRSISAHKNRLAIDLNLFKDGKYLTSSDDHKPLGDYWVSIGGTWGGNFKHKDGNHYSLKYNGVA